jgi:hypothetical protein
MNPQPPHLDGAPDLERRLRWSIEGARPKAPVALRAFVPQVPSEYSPLSRSARLWRKVSARRGLAVAGVGAAVVVALVAGLALASIRGSGPAPKGEASQLAVASNSESPAVSPAPDMSPSGSASASSPSASPSGAGTPSPRGTPGATLKPVKGGWQRGGEVWLVGQIIATPYAFLAACALTEDDYYDGVWSSCSSSDLVHWSSPPDEAVFVNEGRHPFQPAQLIQVKHGYAAADYIANDSEDSVPLEWYSADGIHWSEGIPAGQRLPDPPDPCASEARLNGVCEQAEYIAMDATTGMVVAAYDEGPDEDNYIWTRLAVSPDGGETWSYPTLAKDLWQVYSPPLHLPDGTWVFVFTIMPPPPPPGLYYGGSPSAVVVTSKDGAHWTKQDESEGAVFAAVLGSSVYATFGDYESGDCDLEVSSDGGKTWSAVTDKAGNAVRGEYLQTVGQKVVVFEGIDSDPGRITWVGP